MYAKSLRTQPLPRKTGTIDCVKLRGVVVRKDLSIAQRLRLWLRNLLNRLNKTSLTAEKQAVRTALTALETAIKESGNKAGQGQSAVNYGKPATAKFSIKTLSDGKQYVEIAIGQDLFDSKPLSEQRKIARDLIINRFRNKVVPLANKNAYVNKRSAEEYAYPARRLNPEITEAKMRASTELENMLKISEFVSHENDDGRHSDAIRGWDKYVTRFKVNNKLFEGEVQIKLIEKGDLFYDITKIKDITEGANSSKTASQGISFDTIISTPTEKSNTFEKNSQNIHKEGKKKYSLNESVYKNSPIKSYNMTVSSIDKGKSYYFDSAIGNYIDESKIDTKKVQERSGRQFYQVKLPERFYNDFFEVYDRFSKRGKSAMENRYIPLSMPRAPQATQAALKRIRAFLQASNNLAEGHKPKRVIRIDNIGFGYYETAYDAETSEVYHHYQSSRKSAFEWDTADFNTLPKDSVISKYSLPDADSEGRKLTTNLNPTANEDIRFSLKDGTAASISSVDADKTIVFHGTKYRFDKFLAEHIGTGEGRQAHGWGLYFAADRTTADRYSRQDGHKYYINNKLITDDFESVAAGRIFDFDGKKIPIKEVINDIGNSFSNPQNANKLIEIVKKIYNDVEVSKGNIYTVTIPSENTMLWENKSLSEQPLKVREAIEEYSRERNKKGWSGVSETSGRYIYKDAVFEAQMNGAENPEKAASLLLNSLGINGIVYDGRQDGRSYVVFDDNAVRMLDRVKVVNGEDVKFALKDIDKSTKAKYNDTEKHSTKKRISYIPYSKIGNENVASIKSKLEYIYKEVENGIADGIAIEKGNKVYIVDSGKDEGNITFGIRERLTISDKETRENFIKERNSESISKVFVSKEISSRLWMQYGNGWESHRGQKFGEELRIDTSQSQDNEGSVFNGDANRGIRGLKYSLPNAPYKADIITNVYEEIDGKRTLVRKEFKGATVTEKDGYYHIKSGNETFKRKIGANGTFVLGGTAESAKSKVLLFFIGYYIIISTSIRWDFL